MRPHRLLPMLVLLAVCLAVPAARAEATSSGPTPVLKHGGGLRFSWGLPAPEKEGGFRSIDVLLHQVTVPAADQSLSFATRVLCGTPKARTAISFSLETDVEGKGGGVALARAGAGKSGDVALPPDGGKDETWTVISSADGGTVGTRRLIPWGPGQLRLRLIARGDDNVGRWFELWLLAGKELPVLCGAVRVPRDAHGNAPLILPENAESAVVQSPPLAAAGQLPYWRFFIQGVFVNQGRTLVKTVRCAYGPEADFWANSNLSCSKRGWPIQVQLGADTRRTDAPPEF